MTIMMVALLIGLGAGVLSGLFGIGGGVVIVPALVLALGLEQKTAVGTSLGALILPVGALAVLQYYRSGHVDVRTALMISAGIIVGSFVGARIALGSADLVLRRLFAVLLVVVAVRLFVTA